MSRYLLAAILVAVCVDTRAQGRRELECTGPTLLVRVTAQQLSKTPPTYSFLITNLTAAPIRTVVVGRGERHSLDSSVIAVKDNVPTSMVSPVGWTATHVIGDESPYVTYQWSTSETGKGILPKQSASGFLLTLPDVAAGAQKRYFENKEVSQTRFKGLPFSARTTDGRCFWGLVGADLLDQ